MRTILMLIACAVAMSACNKNNKTASPLEARIDSIFTEWNHDNTPGVAVAVMKNGEYVLRKGYGMANLEYDIPNTSTSIFHIASESKQYTAFCIVLLAKAGKLSLDDDIRKYLPYVPDFKQKITIRNLIHHTSGLRDQWQLLSIQGTRLEDVITTDHVLKLVANQKELNFKVGDRSVYCNTGYTLMGQIVEEVTGQTLRQFADSAIFKPLGMKDTHFHDDNTELVKMRTYSYGTGEDKKFVHAPLNYAVVGATSLFTTVEDELKWVHNYETFQVGGKEAVEQMFEQGVLNNGTKIEYAFALNMGEHNGHKAIGHGGGDAGYRTYAVRFPDEQLCIAVFSNLGSVGPADLAYKVADLYLPAKKEEEKKTEPKTIDKTAFKNLIGHFTSEEGPALRIYDSSKQYMHVYGQETEIQSLSDSTFSIFGGYATFTFKNADKPVDTYKVKVGNDMYDFYRYEPGPLSSSELDDYLGTYESDELDSRYQIVNVDGKPVLRHSKYPDAPLTVITKNQFTSPMWWMDNLNIMREGNKVVGFEVNSGRILHLKFRKIR
ncbi:MAG: serine hydrolase domain-containing protein [Chryseolinea sp.]